MSADYSIKENDTSPAIVAQLLDADGNAVNLTGATVKFLMSRRGADTPKVDAAATVTDPVTGTVSYSWQGTDTDTHGVYNAEWEVVFSGGERQTFPNSRYLEIQVTRDLG